MRKVRVVLANESFNYFTIIEAERRGHIVECNAVHLIGGIAMVDVLTYTAYIRGTHREWKYQYYIRVEKEDVLRTLRRWVARTPRVLFKEVVRE